MVTDDYSPIYVGDTGSPFNPAFVQGNGPYDLTGATISMKMQNLEDPSIIQVCSGAWTINSDPTTGIASYAYTSGDVATAGAWQMSITITKSGKPVHADVKTLEVLPIPFP